MRKHVNILVLGAALVALVGCASITSVPAGPVSLGEQHRVVLGRQWSDVSIMLPQKTPSVRVLSIDGPALNRLYLASLKPGEGLIKAASKEHPVPIFHSDMTSNEELELVTDSVAALGYQHVAMLKLRPAKLSGANGLRFDLAAQTQSGLEVSGAAQVWVSGGKLYLILYLAPAEHYFGTTLPEVEKLMESAA
jgi:hypothetical protein